MIERCILDTGLIIRDLRGDVRASRLFDALLGRYILCVSVITVFESIRGCRSPEQENRAQASFARFYSLAVDYDTALEAGSLIRENAGVFSSERAGADSLIAACASGSRARLATLNTRQFSKLRWPSLDLILIEQDAADWAAGLP
jgi:predicted nucleic acid-binding protein